MAEAANEPKAAEQPDAPVSDQPEAKPEQNGGKPAEEEAVGDAKADDESKQEEAPADAGKPGINFTGSWVLKSSSDTIGDYYKSEGWGYMMRKMAPMIAMKQVIAQVEPCVHPPRVF